MIENLGVKSVLDVGCGRGTSTTWFLYHGLDVLCVEGSHDAVIQSFLSDKTQIVEHDFARGPWWPKRTFDAVWSVEFLEHVGVQYHYNYIQSFRKAALLFVTSSQNGGWHHVQVHDDSWWIQKYESYGFKYSDKLTKDIRKVADNESSLKIPAPNGDIYNAQHIWLTMKVFVNPAVASLPEHAHLFYEPGCYKDYVKGKIVQKECGTGVGGDLETPLPPHFYPTKLTPEMDTKWEDLIRSRLDPEDMKKVNN
jgi:SAM-dependent methyltransferase